jgi:hypothetical protein
MKKTLLIGIAIVALVVGAFALPKLDYRAATAPSVENVKAAKIATVNIVADHLTATRTRSRKIADLGNTTERLNTGPPSLTADRNPIHEQLATSRGRYDAPGWIEPGGLLTAKD